MSVFFISCNTEINITINDNNSATIEIDTNSSKVLENTISTLLGVEEDVVFFSKEEIEKAFSQTDFQVINVKSKGKLGLTLLLKTQNFNKAFNILPEAVKIEKNTIYFDLSPKVMQNVANFLPTDINDYLALLMAPCFDGTSMPSDEYIELINVIYGESLAEELNKAKIKLNFTTSNGKKFFYTETLVDFLSGNLKNTYKIVL
jgi:hypothetical protein